MRNAQLKQPVLSLTARQPSSAINQAQALIGARIRARRLHLGMRQSEVAEQLHATRAQFGHYEVGRTPVTAIDLQQIARILSCSAAYLLGESDRSAEPNIADYYDNLPPNAQSVVRETAHALYIAYNPRAEQNAQNQQDLDHNLSEDHNL